MTSQIIVSLFITTTVAILTVPVSATTTITADYRKSVRARERQIMTEQSNEINKVYATISFIA